MFLLEEALNYRITRSSVLFLYKKIKTFENIKPNADFIRHISIRKRTGGQRVLQYEQWLRAIIHAVSDDYKLSDEEAEGIFKRILRRLKRH